MPTDNTTATPGQPDVTTPIPVVTEPPDGGDGGDEGDTGDKGNPVASELAKERRQRRAADKTVGELRTANQELAAKVQQFEDRDKTDSQRATDALEAQKAKTKTAEDERDAARLELLRYQVGIDKGIAPEFIDRLRGDTREDIEADADRLAPALAGQPAPPARPRPVGALGRGNTAPVSTADQFAAAMKTINR